MDIKNWDDINDAKLKEIVAASMETTAVWYYAPKSQVHGLTYGLLW